MRFANGAILPGRRDYGDGPAPRAEQLSYSGEWTVAADHATAAAGGTLALNFNARHVYLVLGSPGRPRELRLSLDGRPLPARAAGADVRASSVRVIGQRLYELVDLPAVGRHVLRLRPQPGIDAYAFTFG